MATVHLVLRRDWLPESFGRTVNADPECGRPVAAFRDRAQAAAAATLYEIEARLANDPFAFGSDRDCPDVNLALIDAGVTHLPLGVPADGDDWHEWWVATASELSAADALVAWDALGGGQFFRVIDVDYEGGA